MKLMKMMMITIMNKSQEMTGFSGRQKLTSTEIFAFIIGFSCTVWTKMRSLAG